MNKSDSFSIWTVLASVGGSVATLLFGLRSLVASATSKAVESERRLSTLESQHKDMMQRLDRDGADSRQWRDKIDDALLAQNEKLERILIEISGRT